MIDEETGNVGGVQLRLGRATLEVTLGRPGIEATTLGRSVTKPFPDSLTVPRSACVGRGPGLPMDGILRKTAVTLRAAWLAAAALRSGSCLPPPALAACLDLGNRVRNAAEHHRELQFAHHRALW
jgi:hypothetical protein